MKLDKSEEGVRLEGAEEENVRRDGLPSRARLRAGGARLRARLCQRCAVPLVGAIRLGSRGGMDNGSKGCKGGTPPGA